MYAIPLTGVTSTGDGFAPGRLCGLRAHKDAIKNVALRRLVEHFVDLDAGSFGVQALGNKATLGRFNWSRVKCEGSQHWIGEVPAPYPNTEKPISTVNLARPLARRLQEICHGYRGVDIRTSLSASGRKKTRNWLQDLHRDAQQEAVLLRVWHLAQEIELRAVDLD